jgi:uncharacterized protein YjdB
MFRRLIGLSAVLVALACSKDSPAEPEPLVVTITPVNPTLGTGQELRLQASISRGLTPLFEWESDLPNVATVSLTGIVTAVTPGSAVIKATWSSDSTVFGTTRVTVTDGVEDRSALQRIPPR